MRSSNWFIATASLVSLSTISIAVSLLTLIFLNKTLLAPLSLVTGSILGRAWEFGLLLACVFLVASSIPCAAVVYWFGTDEDFKGLVSASEAAAKVCWQLVLFFASEIGRAMQWFRRTFSSSSSSFSSSPSSFTTPGSGPHQTTMAGAPSEVGRMEHSKVQ